MQYSRDCITITSNNLFFHFQKHPHLRGENLDARHQANRGWETSPPAWGKQMREVSARNASRNIPTCVGKTGAVEADGVTDEETSPPAWGKLQASSPVEDSVETSPPAWGKHTTKLTSLESQGNIPTCVGKTMEVQYSM